MNPDVPSYELRRTPCGKLTVDVAFPSFGNGIIREVSLDGVKYAEAMKKQNS